MIFGTELRSLVCPKKVDFRNLTRAPQTDERARQESIAGENSTNSGGERLALVRVNNRQILSRKVLLGVC